VYEVGYNVMGSSAYVGMFLCHRDSENKRENIPDRISMCERTDRRSEHMAGDAWQENSECTQDQDFLCRQSYDGAKTKIPV
jgi:hypothetical protein